jgi:hypothetical protein
MAMRLESPTRRLGRYARLLVAAALIAGCTQTAGTPTPATAGVANPPSVTVFTLALSPNSLVTCILADQGMLQPMTFTVTANSAVLLTTGGIHYELPRIRPNVYASDYWVKIEADLSVRPKRLTVRNFDGSCQWLATAP